MSELPIFLVEQAAITIPLAIMMIALLVIELRIKQTQSVEVAPDRAIELVNRHRGVLIDIRPKEAFEAGRIGGAVHSSVAQLTVSKNFHKYKTRPLVLIADDMREAKTVRQQLIEKGYESAYILTGGIANWRKQGLPVV